MEFFSRPPASLRLALRHQPPESCGRIPGRDTKPPTVHLAQARHVSLANRRGYIHETTRRVQWRNSECFYDENDGKMFLAVYVDDGLIAASDEGLIDTFFLELGKNFKITTTKDVSNYLGIEIFRLRNGSIFISQSKYIEGIIEKFNFTDANYVSTPIEVGWDASDFIKDSCHGVPYREVVDSLMFLQTVSGPDISFAVNIASRVLDKPTKAHWLLVKRIIRYLKDTPTAEYYKTIETNVIAPTICAREFLQSIKKRNTCGHIVNINSIAGHFAEAIHVPVGMYAASKYAVTALCSELRHEIIAANLNVKVTSISPGLVRTEMVQDFIANLDVRTLEPEDIADSAIYAIGTPERVEIHEITIIPHGTPIVDLNSSLQTKQ
nr:PREDICTED: uncharacterized protein LOC105664123 isoform X2 [Megachile rotundata]